MVGRATTVGASLVVAGSSTRISVTTSVSLIRCQLRTERQSKHLLALFIGVKRLHDVDDLDRLVGEIWVLRSTESGRFNVINAREDVVVAVLDVNGRLLIGGHRKIELLRLVDRELICPMLSTCGIASAPTSTLTLQRRARGRVGVGEGESHDGSLEVRGGVDVRRIPRLLIAAPIPDMQPPDGLREGIDVLHGCPDVSPVHRKHCHSARAPFMTLGRRSLLEGLIAQRLIRSSSAIPFANSDEKPNFFEGYSSFLLSLGIVKCGWGQVLVGC